MTLQEDWQPSDSIVLEPNADLAVRETARSVALTAGPGSGKTELLAQRTDFLLRSNSSPFPRRVLAISFKVDASRNLSDRVRLRCGKSYAKRFDSYTFHGFAKRLIDRYRLALNDHVKLEPNYKIGAERTPPTQITFGDLVPLATYILQTNDYARNALRQAYSHVLLDEFQDCTDSQYTLIEAAFLTSDCILTAVGDTKQQIMGFAGAMDGIFERYADDFSARRLNMYQNHRSATRIRRVHNAMVKEMDFAAALPPGVLTGSDGDVQTLQFETSSDEASYIAKDISERARSGALLSDIAVIVPREPHFYLAEVMMQLDRLNIPYRNEQEDQDLTAEPLFELINDFLMVVLTRRAPESYVNLMGRLIEADLDETEEYSYRDRWDRYVRDWRKRFKPDDPADAGAVLHAVNLFVRRFSLVAAQALSPGYQHGDFLQQVYRKTTSMIEETFSANRTYESCARSLGAEESVRLLTVHKSKGLEFDTVYVVGAERSFYSNSRTDQCTFFVAISRAKLSLQVTQVERRIAPPNLPDWKRRKWTSKPARNTEFLAFFANEHEDG